MTRAPNILLIMADQLAPQVLPAYGHRVVRTPHIDRLAREGVVFDSAYCNFPLCAPARFSMLSGRLPSAIGAFDNAVEFPASTATFTHYLRAAGYRTCLAGKMHFVGPDQLHGFEERVTTDVYPADFLWTPDWDLGDEAWVEWYHGMRAVLDAGPGRRSENTAYDDEVEFEAIRWLHERADAGDERPFFLTASFISPHDPYLAPQRWWDEYADADIDPPAVGDIALDERDPHSRRHYHFTGRHLETVGPDDVLRMRRAYYAVTSYLDHKVGRLLEALEQTGERDRTLVVFTADHGDSLGERGLFFKMSFFEWSVRVPLILHAPWAFQAGRVDTSVSHLDLFPTLLEVAGDGAMPDLVTRIDGQSLTGLAAGAPGEGHRPVLAEYTAEGTSAPMLMVRDGAYKLITCPTDPPLLYHLASDPDERQNLAGDPGHAVVLRDMTALAAARWDVDQLARRVRDSQAERRLVARALASGQRTPWDHQPHRDASRLYFRELGDIQASYEVR